MFAIKNLARFQQNFMVVVAATLVLLIHNGASVQQTTEAASVIFAPMNESPENEEVTEVIWPETDSMSNEPGCRLVGHQVTVSEPGCVVFTVSVNACRGDSLSYSIPMAEEVDMLDLADMQIAKQLVSYRVGQQNENDLSQVEDEGFSIKYLSNKNHRPSAENGLYNEYSDIDAKQGNHLRRSTSSSIDFNVGSVIEQFTLEELTPTNSKVLEAADEFYDKLSHHQDTTSELINVSRCCSIEETRDSEMQARDPKNPIQVSHELHLFEMQAPLGDHALDLDG